MSKSSQPSRSLLHRIGVAGSTRLRVFQGAGAPSRVYLQKRGVWLRAVVGVVTVGVMALLSPTLAAGTGDLGFQLNFLSSPSCPGQSHTSILLEAEIKTESATSWSFAYSTTKGGPWTPVPGGSGTITQAQAEKLGEHFNPEKVQGELTGVTPEVTYYVLATATSSAGTIEEEAREGTKIGCEAVPLHTAPSISRLDNVTATSAHVVGVVNPDENASEINWHYEYAPAEGGPWSPVPGATGTISKAEAEAAPSGGPFPTPEAELTALKPGTVYYVRLFAEDEPEYPQGSSQNVHKEATSIPERFETSGPPIARTFSTHTLHGEAIRILGSVTPNNPGLNAIQTVTIGGAPTGGAFTLAFPGQTTQATGTGDLTSGSTTISNVLTSTGILKVENHDSISGAGIPPGTTIAGFDPDAKDTVPPEAVITLSQPATASGTAVAFTVALPALPPNATAKEVNDALVGLSNGSSGNVVSVSGPAGGPYTVEFVNEKGSSSEPLLVANASGLTPSGTVTVVTTRAGFNYETRYHFEYIAQRKFAETGWTGATATPEHQIEDTSTHIVGEDLPGLQPGETYDYRIVANNTTPGNPVSDGALETFTVPTATVEPPAACENERSRTGLSARLPDCRAYEQVTPVDKEGAQEPFDYGPTTETGALVGTDGEHVVLYAPQTKWGSGPGAGQGPYLFSRGSSGWQTTAASLQPETGVNLPLPQVFSADLTQFGFKSYWQTALASGSPNMEFKAGSPGGPYATVASVPRGQVGVLGGWVASSEDGSKLVLQVEDHDLIPAHTTGTTSGFDLYEYSREAGLRQANVTTAGATIGDCGARIVQGSAEVEDPAETASTPRSVSADGSRVFFEAVPTGAACSEPTHLYMRTDGTATVDIGAYRFAAANPQGTRLLLEKQIGKGREFFLYDVESAAPTPAFSVTTGTDEGHIQASKELTAIYITTPEQIEETEAPPIPEFRVKNIYRYDVSTATLHFLVQATQPVVELGGSSPDGRYYYFEARNILGFPNGVEPANGEGAPGQVYRYDSAANVVQCMSCASSLDPEPVPGSHFASYGIFKNDAQGVNPTSSFSANGDYAFFDTTAALVPSDVDGEIIPGSQSPGGFTPSSDVYEWRREGLDGCSHVQGCLSLISSGGGSVGGPVILLGTAHEGRDVFFTTSAQLLRQDNDAAEDIYDARIGGGFPEASPPTECEGDNCSTPFAPPSDSTPSSATFQGAGDLVAEVGPPATAKKKVALKKKRKAKKKPKKKPVRKKRAAKKASHDRRGK